ncbi:hypothetical protein D9C73_021682 [Collichthys lucidus]|uniref:Uncharacterized protein n=1 Tax=Collichthys lucidus TaxID=240159 RepID=A0A4U5VHB7_COLLU|nr:hypothetical protein D9C73_021682 [Collichthys lucidus]
MLLTSSNLNADEMNAEQGTALRYRSRWNRGPAVISGFQLCISSFPRMLNCSCIIMKKCL